jgi:hypothetical protein
LLLPAAIAFAQPGPLDTFLDRQFTSEDYNQLEARLPPVNPFPSLAQAR